MEERDETHVCKICGRTFKCGRALGGHMKSHLIPLKVPLFLEPTNIEKSEDERVKNEEDDDEDRAMQEEIEENFVYSLRENRRKSLRVSDPEFSFTIDASSSGCRLPATTTVCDSQSDTEEQYRPTGKRAHRRRSAGGGEASPASSVSDMSPEEDVAISLMLLSRDLRPPESFSSPVPKQRRKFQCGVCRRFFPSYQALGGHRAGHKKSKGSCSPAGNVEFPKFADDRKIFECPFCFRVFASGQALGGHKRIHASGAGEVATEESTFDLNLPAVDDSTSAVSYADFFDPENPNKLQKTRVSDRFMVSQMEFPSKIRTFPARPVSPGTPPDPFVLSMRVA